MDVNDYFDMEGNFLFRTPTDNNVVIIDNNGVNTKPTDYDYSKGATGNREMLTNIESFYANKAGFTQDVEIFDMNDEKTPFASISTKTCQPQIVVNNGKVGESANYTGNTISSYVHEKEYVGDSNPGSPLGELKAILAQVNDPSFVKSGNDPEATTHEFKEAADIYAVGQLNKGLTSKGLNKITEDQAIFYRDALNESPLGSIQKIDYYDFFVLRLPQTTITGEK